MGTPPPADTTPGNAPTSRGFAVPARLFTFVTFMCQFMSILFVGGYASTLHDRGVSTAVLTVGAVVGGIALLWVISLLGKLVPVRCRQCGGRARYTGLRWWPFIYYYACRACGSVLKHEMQGR